VADEIKALIARGELGEGETLPPVRQLAADLGVNMNTIAVSYRQLQTEGLITIKHGSGAVVASRFASKADEKQLRRPLKNALTSLVLAGLSTSRIMRIVKEEMGELSQK
jgi:GntR family transcriptional regulator